VKVLIVTGIWPPDVGGPASHAPELAAYLSGRGHGVEVVTTAHTAPAPAPYPVHSVSRRLPPGLRHLAVAGSVARRARAADAVYATSMLGRASLGAALARRPLVVKLTGDEAYERARRRGMFAGDLDAFQEHTGDLRMRVLRRIRDLAVGRAAHVFSPSEYLRGLAIRWGVPAERVSTLPNAAPELPPLRPREELRRELGMEGPALAFAGRLTEAKSLDVAFEALAQVDGGIELVLAGDGPDRPALERRCAELGLQPRIRFLGSQPRERVLELFRAADAALLSSSWENFPHTVVEALAAGAPMIATAVGGVPEVVRDGENGLLVPPGDPEQLAAAIRRYFEDHELRGRLRAAAAPSVEAYRPEWVLGRIEAELLRAAGERGA
jgi:glycosyltransferase involved in cell wall biosynthesis